ncbi:MAG: ubiquinone/menaquinone biosynthesis methyltransferase [Deltaproteobacteria bacterium]|nr:ubiquinone/menaquinone biosynthesis methyltransferase [Deltaproteobacteria bacterium]MBW2307216.1 ubiquinone/menaquinone biosynthesis methyltransferase [Deltaproteobacteria bacterium]
MFARIAGRYDLMNHLLSANLDILWRKKAAMACGPGHRALDLCIGSGDMALAWVREHQEGKVVGLDFCRELLERVNKKSGGNSRIIMVEGDALDMPFADGSFDAVMCAFGMRNLADVEKGMHEVARVMRRGGCCTILDFFRPRHWIPRAFYATYARYLIPLVGRWIAEDSNAYEYLHRSVRKFLSLEEFSNLMTKVGFEDIHHRHLTAGVATVLSGRRKL